MHAVSGAAILVLSGDDGSMHAVSGDAVLSGTDEDPIPL